MSDRAACFEVSVASDIQVGVPFSMTPSKNQPSSPHMDKVGTLGNPDPSPGIVQWKKTLLAKVRLLVTNRLNSDSTVLRANAIPHACPLGAVPFERSRDVTALTSRRRRPCEAQELSAKVRDHHLRYLRYIDG